MKNTFFDRLTLICFIFLLSLGQLERLQLTQSIAIYFHDILIIFYLFIQFILAFPARKKIIQKLQKNKYFSKKLFICSFCWIAVGWLYQLGRGTFQWTALLYFARFFAYLAFVFLLRYKFPRTGRIAFLIAVILLCLGWLQYFFLPDLRFLKLSGYDDHYYRLTSTLLDPNFIGLIFVLAIIYLFAHHVTFAKPWFGLLLLAFSGALLLTYSRSSYLTFFFVLGFLICLPSTSKRQRIGLFALVGLSVLAIPFLPQQMGGEGVNLLRTASVNARVVHDQAILQQLTPVEWIIGNGFLHPQPNISSFYATHAHFADNWLIFFITNFGLLGSSVLILYLLRRAKQAYQKQQWLPLLFAMAFFVHASFNNDFSQSFVFLLFLCFFLEKKLISEKSL